MIRPHAARPLACRAYAGIVATLLATLCACDTIVEHFPASGSPSKIPPFPASNCDEETGFELGFIESGSGLLDRCREGRLCRTGCTYDEDCQNDDGALVSSRCIDGACATPCGPDYGCPAQMACDRSQASGTLAGGLCFFVPSGSDRDACGLDDPARACTHLQSEADCNRRLIHETGAFACGWVTRQRIATQSDGCAYLPQRSTCELLARPLASDLLPQSLLSPRSVITSTSNGELERVSLPTRAFVPVLDFVHPVDCEGDGQVPACECRFETATDVEDPTQADPTAPA